ncbi:MAG: porin [Puniceicoccales bacterium]|jgi:hypothetical protein|nr:porin [Puniceicoccales bacterium]
MQNNLKIAGFTAVLTAAASLTATAAGVPINDYLSVDGYVAAAATYTKTSSGSHEYTLFDSPNGDSRFGSNLDQIKFGLRAKYKDFGAYASVLYYPDRVGAREAGILDAYVYWKNEASGVTVTAGKFLSSFGYESYYPIYNSLISGSLVSGIPGYHTGLKVEYAHAGSGFSTGLAVVDSLQPGRGFEAGDGDLHDVGIELYFKYQAVKGSFLEGLTIFTGVGLDTGRDDKPRRVGFDEFGDSIYDTERQWVVDFWAEYQVTDQLRFAAEVSYAERVANISWLAFGEYSFTSGVSLAARVSGYKYHDDQLYSIGVAPTLNLGKLFEVKAIEGLSLRGEISYLYVKDGHDGYFFGSQLLFQF